VTLPPAILPIEHNRPTLGAEEQEAACRVLSSNWVAQGPEVAAFEDEVCAFLGLRQGHAVALSSGSAALYLALKILARDDSRVACPVYACSALTNAIALAATTPILIDTNPNDPNIDGAALLASGADIAIVPHMFGFPAFLPDINEVRIIEDVAQALGSSVVNRPAGISGNVGIFSFYASKVITTGGQGGMLVSRDRNIVEAARDYRAFDCRKDRQPRFNFQMTDLQAAVGRVQLVKLPAFLSRRNEIFERYRHAGLDLLEPESRGRPIRYRCVIRSKAPRSLIEHLSGYGINAIVPIEDWELLGPAEQFPNATELTRTTVSLPIYPSLTDKEQDRIISSLDQIMSRTQ
jgi:perosamine synthetase